MFRSRPAVAVALATLHGVYTPACTDVISPVDRCWSYVGRTGRKQQLSLAGGCWYKGTVAHELGKKMETKLNIARQQLNQRVKAAIIFC